MPLSPPAIAVPQDAGIYAASLPPSVFSIFTDAVPDKATYTAPAFGPHFVVGGTRPDIVLIASDDVRFHVHRFVLAFASTNNFANLLCDGRSTISLPESRLVLNIALHAIYDMPYTLESSTLSDVESALDALVKYGVPVTALATPPRPLYHLLLSFAPFEPIVTYALAGRFDLEAVAVATSSHLLGYDTATLSDTLAIKMGPVYLRRLLGLHQHRLSVLKEIVLCPPREHSIPAGRRADGEHRELGQLWAFAAAQLVWDALPSESRTHCVDRCLAC